MAFASKIPSKLTELTERLAVNVFVEADLQRFAFDDCWGAQVTGGAEHRVYGFCRGCFATFELLNFFAFGYGHGAGFGE